MKFKVGLIGLGKVGALYDVSSSSSSTMSHLNAIAKDNRFELSFAYDPCEATCASVKKYYGFHNIFYNFVDLKSAKLEADLIVVACPTNLHLEAIQAVLQFLKPKMILCEKPLAKNQIDSQKIAEICRQNHVEIITNFMRRSLPLFISIKEKITNQLPAKHDVVIKYSGCFMNNGSHFVDLMTYFFGKPDRLLLCSSERIDESRVKVRAVASHKYAICSYIPLNSTSVVDHEVEIMTDKFKIAFEKAGRDVKIYDVSEDRDFSGTLMYDRSTYLDSDYLNFQKYVYEDLHVALKTGVIPSNLCDIETSLENINFMNGMIHCDD